MKIAFISDIHANLPALESVISEVRSCDMILCCGDVVGYYAEPNQVCELLRDLRIPTIRGNHDAYVTGHLESKPEYRQAYRIDWTKEVLKKSNLEWLSNLPIEMRFCWDDLRVTIRHANPWDEEQYLYPDSELLDQIQLEQNDIFVLGHTHRPMQRSLGKGLLINPGSVGQPRDYNSGPSYAILDVHACQVELRRTTYAFESYQQSLKQKGWDQSVIDILSRTNLEASAT